MHGGGIFLARAVLSSTWKPDLVLVSDMIDLSVFKSLLSDPFQGVSFGLYFHENQLTYPTSGNDTDKLNRRDNHYAFINFTSCLTADFIIFNSKFHRDSFCNALPAFLGKFPDHAKLLDYVSLIRAKSTVIAPGFDHRPFEGKTKNIQEKTPVILWNHRWEYDKNPELFFSVLKKIKDDNNPFKLVVLGKSYGKTPAIFEYAREHFRENILHFGFVKDTEDYAQWLINADLIVSTSNQEFFGISVAEAIYANCFPLIPNRLAFPELIPDHLHPRCLYTSEEDLYTKASSFVSNFRAFKPLADLINHIKKFTCENVADRYGSFFSTVIES